jgi:hypothetical protein
MLANSRLLSSLPPAAKAAACTLLLIALEASAQLMPSDAPLQYSASLLGQGNPRLGALDLRLQYRHPLGGADSGSAIGGFAAIAAGPAGVRPGVGFQIQPMPILSFGVDYFATYYFGTQGLAQSYPSPLSEYGSGAFSAPPDGPGGSYALWVQQLSMHAMLQGILGPIAVRNTTRASRFFANLHGNDRVFYDPLLDVVVYKDGWVGQNETDVVYLLTSSFIVGLRYSLTIAWYPSDAYGPGEPQDDPNTPTAKLGPIAAWQFLQSDGGAVQRGNLLLTAQWYLAHRYRTGATVSGAFPFFGIGLVFSGDLVRSR